LIEDAMAGYLQELAQVRGMLDSLTTRPLRFQSLRDDVIAYASDEKPLAMIAVLHGRRTPRVIAAILRGRT
jgi:hypothetical protein